MHPFVLAMCLIIPYEVFRLKHANEDCYEQQFKDLDLLSRDVCANPEDRLLFKDSVQCEAAEKRQRFSINECTIHKWSDHSDVLEKHYYPIIVCSMILILWYMYLWSKRRSEAHFIEKMHQLKYY